MFNNFTEYVKIKDVLGTHGAILVEDGFDWTKDFKAPNLNLDLPTTTKTGKIAILIQKKNPIFIQLKDKTRLFLTPQEFRRIQGEPCVGKTVKITFLRLPQDQSISPSQITKFEMI